MAAVDIPRWKRYAIRNRAKRADQQRAWYYRNLDRARRVTREYYQRNKDKVNALRKIKRHVYRKNSGRCDNRSANVLSQIVSSAERLKCGICGRNMSKNDRSIDHIIPLSKGGSNEIWNLRIVHLVCNIRKNRKMPHEFDGQSELAFSQTIERKQAISQ